MANTIYTCGLSTPDQKAEYLLNIPVKKEMSNIKWEINKKENKMYLAYSTEQKPNEIVFNKEAFIAAGGEILKWDGEVPLCTINEEFTKQPTDKLWDEICKGINGEHCELDKRSVLQM